jgi:hypothetical protein
LVADTGLIPFSSLHCYCSHTRGMHSLGAEKCDNCDCSQFRLDRSRALGTTKELTVIDDEAPDPSQTLDSKVADKDRGGDRR